MTSKVSVDEVNAFYDSVFQGAGPAERVLEVRENFARIRQPVDSGNIRPGGYINGPTQMAVADSAAYIAIFTRIGITPMALTSNLNINFMRPCIGEAVIADAHLLKLGRTLAVVSVEVRAEGSDKISSHAVVNYSIPLEVSS
ncbi:MAG: PaaI family thioesterase [Pseudomonadota bacterium]|nr:PaaI family thioesterase [Pseudomonadota bacterium]